MNSTQLLTTADRHMRVLRYLLITIVGAAYLWRYLRPECDAFTGLCTSNAPQSAVILAGFVALGAGVVWVLARLATLNLTAQLDLEEVAEAAPSVDAESLISANPRTVESLVASSEELGVPRSRVMQLIDELGITPGSAESGEVRLVWQQVRRQVGLA